MAKRSVRSEVMGKQIVQERTYAAPRELVWQMWTDVKHLDRWWGPNGFRNETLSRDFVVGGTWRYLMHGPDGKTWPNWVRYETIVPLERLAYAHGGGDGGDGGEPHFHTTVTFETVPEGTRVTMTGLFPSLEAVEAVKKFGAVKSGMENLSRLVGYLPYVSSSGKMILSRWFDSPPAKVWAAWSSPAELKKWWGPLGFSLPECELEFRVGGRYRMVMADGAGQQYPFHGEFLAIVPGERLVFESIIGEGTGERLTTEVTFTADGDGTILTVAQTVPTTNPFAAKGQLEGWNGSLIKLGAVVP